MYLKVLMVRKPQTTMVSLNLPAILILLIGLPCVKSKWMSVRLVIGSWEANPIHLPIIAGGWVAVEIGQCAHCVKT